MNEMKYTDSIRAWRLEVTSKKARKAAEDEGKTYAPSVELLTQYAPGEFVIKYDLRRNRELVLKDPDGIRIGTDVVEVCKRLGLSVGSVTKFSQNVEAAGGWLETSANEASVNYNGDVTLRMIALAERPKIDLAKTEEATGKFDDWEKSMIEIDGEPLMKEGAVLSNGMSVFKSNLAATLGAMIAAHVKEKTGAEVKVTLPSVATLDCEFPYADFTLEAASREDAQKALKEVFGIRDPERLKPQWEADGDGTGKRTVRYMISFCEGID